jgi:arylsulfatase A-like enzyme
MSSSHLHAARRLVVAVAAATLVGGGCAQAPREEQRARNLVVVLVDTLRADHLSLYGYGRPTTPALAARAARGGVVFEQTRAQAPCTFPSVNSMLTSRSPATFYARGLERDFGIPDDIPSLSVRLAAAGYETAAVSASPIVRARPSTENPTAGFGAGFNLFDEFCYWREARCVSARGLEVVSTLQQPFYLYLHYMDPHDPYRLPSDVGLDGSFARSGYGDGPDPQLTEDELAHLVDLYDDEILYWDREFEPLVEQLLERFPDTAVAIVSDHGEEFLEHGSVKHCRTLYDTELRVPFVLFVPGQVPRRITAPVSNLDLVPTLLDLVGLPQPDDELGGRSLLGLIDSGSSADFAQYAVSGRFWSIVFDHHKLIQTSVDARVELFDLAADPGELTDLALTDAERVEMLSRRLTEWRRLQERLAYEGAEEARKLLRSVGYLQ